MTGATTITIGAEGYSEPRKLDIAATVTVTGARAWRLYDDQWQALKFVQGNGSASLPGGGAFVMIYGEAASAATITLT